jgi:hypothetical protein
VAGLVPAIHAFLVLRRVQDVDARHKAGHDELAVYGLRDGPFVEKASGN